MNLVISQPMFFPWVGLYEQIKNAEVFVHYTDVQFSKGSFTNRVQIKTSQGSKWLTIPLERLSLGQKINEVKISNKNNWKKKHISLLAQAYSNAPFKDDMLNIVELVYANNTMYLSELVVNSVLVGCEYFGLNKSCKFINVEDLNINGSGSERVLAIAKKLKANKYITGLGASKYLDHEGFESSSIQVFYMNYSKKIYPQCHGEFTPYVSILDLIANVGATGAKYICSNTIYWKEFLDSGRNTKI